MDASRPSSRSARCRFTLRDGHDDDSRPPGPPVSWRLTSRLLSSNGANCRRTPHAALVSQMRKSSHTARQSLASLGLAGSGGLQASRGSRRAWRESRRAWRESLSPPIPRHVKSNRRPRCERPAPQPGEHRGCAERTHADPCRRRAVSLRAFAASAASVPHGASRGAGLHLWSGLRWHSALRRRRLLHRGLRAEAQVIMQLTCTVTWLEIRSGQTNAAPDLLPGRHGRAGQRSALCVENGADDRCRFLLCSARGRVQHRMTATAAMKICRMRAPLDKMYPH